MSAPLFISCLWVLAATVTAMLPMRRQFVPGLVLLGLAPVLIVWIGVVHGPTVAILGVLAFLSMFRRPLIYLIQRARGRNQTPPEDPPE
ncbi:hypothetical protein AIOL_003024 [Candidatus Rhodobacter oscarellae]|uniref:UDP-N-acetylmuramate--alanine ligase n=1 Tax=Candidatus Rhodobacter oscarellae TaxID=1675527 RepID=A0A0J9E8L7_9RHOB|nr:DUF2484 family protein [Candidatus Rhodobacter lobularis]KMW58054.1 hypothetical protein AIOL_003024 [Candidatus Rhodobacter lobularis]